MFEYLMPSIWMRHYPGTITDNSTSRGSRPTRVRPAQRRSLGYFESACLARDGSDGYAAFGIPELAMKTSDSDALVVSPYYVCLAAT